MINYLSYQHTTDIKFGELNSFFTDEFNSIVSNRRNIVIYGHTKSGKVQIGKYVSSYLGLPLFKTDDYLHLDFKQQLYGLIEDIDLDSRFIVEGVQCCRFLRKGIELGFKPDLVIEVLIDYECVEYCYHRDGESDKLKANLKNFNYGFLDGIYNDWKSKFSLTGCDVDILVLNTSFKL